MDDEGILELLTLRREDAIAEIQKKYGGYCHKIARNILSRPEDAEECVNEALLCVWNRIPPLRPVSLKSFLGKLVRDAALSRYRMEHAKKRNCEMMFLLQELDECIPAVNSDLLNALHEQELTESVNAWLRSLEQDDRILFVKRYYYGEPVKSLAAAYGCTPNQMAQRMRKLRSSLRSHLLKQGVSP